MIIEMLALGGILSVGFKAFQKSRDINQSSVTSQMKITNVNPAQNTIKQFVGKTSNDKQLTQTFEKKSKRKMVAASLALSFSIIGFVSQFFVWLSIPFLVYVIWDILKETYQLLKQGKVNVSTLISITMVGCIIRGHLFIASLIIALHIWALKLMTQLLQNSQQQLVDVFEHYPTTVWIIVEGKEVEIPFNQL